MSVLDQDGSGHVPDDFRKKLSNIKADGQEKKFAENIKAGKVDDTDIAEQEEDEDEDEDEDEAQAELNKKAKTQIPTPAMNARDPLTALAQVSPGAKQFVAEFGDKYTEAIKKYTQSDILHLVEDKNGTYEYKGKRYRYRLKFTDPPSEEVEKIDLAFAKATEAETESAVVKQLAKAYVNAFMIYYGCEEDIPKKYIGKAQLRSIVDSLNWLERQGFR